MGEIMEECQPGIAERDRSRVLMPKRKRGILNRLLAMRFFLKGPEDRRMRQKQNEEVWLKSLEEKQDAEGQFGPFAQILHYEDEDEDEEEHSGAFGPFQKFLGD